MRKKSLFSVPVSGFVKATALLLVLCLFLTGCGDKNPSKNLSQSFSSKEETANSTENAADPDEKETEAFLSFCDDLFREIAASNIINLHYTLADPSAYGIQDYEVTLGSWDPEANQEDYASTKEIFDELQSYDRNRLNTDARLTYDILEDYLTVTLDSKDYFLYEEPLSTTSGDHIELPILLAEYVFYSEKDIEDYLAIIQDLPRYFSTIIEFEQAKAKAGLFMSDDIADTVIKQCQNFLADPENNFLLATLPERLNALEDLSDDQKNTYTDAIRDAVFDSAFTAYNTLIDALTELKASSDNADHDETGICSLPEGKNYYSVLLKRDVGTDKTPEELKQCLLDTLDEKIRLISLQYTEEVAADMSDTSDALADPEEILLDLQEKIREDFPDIDDITYSVKYVPSALEESTSPAFYLTPPLDHSDENVIYINEKYTDLSSLYETLAHEGYPGHLLQTVYFNRYCSIPLRKLLSCSGYVEGWATYVEMQSFGWTDMYEARTAKVASANQEATLCLYGLMDIGVNYEGWTLDELTDFVYDYFGIDDTNIAKEIFDTLIGEPANYLNYIGGCLEWEALRKDQEALLDDFSPLAFHSKALEIGPCPFYILRNYMSE